MSAAASEQAVSRRSVDWWRWGGRIFLALLLVFTVMPMRG